jgi:glycosyltransferase involved in cell wall biosynthesis
MIYSKGEQPLVSVIIPCFNHSRFLGDAIASVQKQTYANIEIIVVDDGSTDNCRAVAVGFANVKYVYQDNAGLSAARNRGLLESKGQFIVFLDADDVLYPDAVSFNLKFLREFPSLAFVSGWHEKVDEWLNPLEETDEATIISNNHYQHFLRGNYVGMHAAVMYTRRTLDEFNFDTTLHACEDYDLYFKISRKYPVGCHGKKLAAYRQHTANMSGNIPLMLTAVLRVLDRQRVVLRSQTERRALQEGFRTWKKYYAERLCDQLLSSIPVDRTWPSVYELNIIGQALPSRLARYIAKKARYNFGETLKRSLPDQTLKFLHHIGIYKQYTPPPGKIEPGDFQRVKPFSTDFGFDRGGAIDRFYIEHFLAENRQSVRGKVLEIGDNEYTLKYGQDRVLQSDILHIDSGNTKATYIGDITDVPQIPSEQFDCIIFTQTLHLIYDFTSALRTCYRILKPGGCLLLTVPGISHIDQGEWKDYWLWSFTDASIKRLMRDTFNGSSVNIKTYGNVYVAAAFLYGMGLPEFRKEFLFHHDPSYQVIITARAVKV